MTRRRLAAAVALVLGVAAPVLALAVFVTHFPLGIGVLACVTAAIAAAWYGVRRRGAARAAGAIAAGVLIAGALAQVALEGSALEDALVVAVAALAATAAAAAFRIHVTLPPIEPPRRAVLFMNPRSGGGKAVKLDLAAEARRRGIDPVTLQPGDDLVDLVRTAVANGTDALAMAGGDGSQAIVAAIAAETGLPYACIPAGTRNHFALDLGVDRDDVVGALDAFVDGAERRVDLADVNGRVFVNNVSLGLYADAVQRASYRNAKLRTLLDTVPDVLGSEAAAHELRWRAADGAEQQANAAILISNNPYRLGRAVASGTRPRVDDGVLGIVVIGAQNGHRPWVEWSEPSFEVRADGRVAAGVDGEAATLEAPLRFRMRPGVLRVRTARSHPGASPSAVVPDSLRDGVAVLAGIALHGRYRSARAR